MRVSMSKEFKSTFCLGNNGKKICMKHVWKEPKENRLIELGQKMEGLACQETFLCLFILFNKKFAVYSPGSVDNIMLQSLA